MPNSFIQMHSWWSAVDISSIQADLIFQVIFFSVPYGSTDGIIILSDTIIQSNSINPKVSSVVNWTKPYVESSYSLTEHE